MAKKKSRKGLWITLISIAAVIVLAGGGIAIWYGLQKPTVSVETGGSITAGGGTWVYVDNPNFKTSAGATKPLMWNLTGGATYSANDPTCGGPCVILPTGSSSPMLSQSILIDPVALPNGLTAAKSANFESELLYYLNGQISLDYFNSQGKQAGPSTFIYLKNELPPETRNTMTTFRTIKKTITIPLGTSRIGVSVTNSSMIDQATRGGVYLKKLDLYFKAN